MEKLMALIYTYINNNQLEDIIIEKPIFIKATKKITCLNKKPKRKCGKKIYVRKTLKCIFQNPYLHHTHTII